MPWHINCTAIFKNSIMANNEKGSPSSGNKKPERSSRKGQSGEDLRSDKNIHEKNEQNDDEVADKLPMRHRNRNTDKDDATNAGGYKE